MTAADAALAIVPAEPGRGGDTALPRGLQKLLEAETSLTGSEAKALVALLGLRTASLKQLSEATGIRRSNIHSVMDSLSVKGLCSRLRGRSSVWECPKPADVLALLRMAEEERLDAARSRLERAFEEADAMLTDPPPDPEDLPFTLVEPARLMVIYEDAMAAVDDEILVINRGPYAGEMSPIAQVLEAMARGVKARALWLRAELDAPDGQLRRCADAYEEAGVEQRIVDRVPASMAIIGGQTALVSVPTRGASPALPVYGTAVKNEAMVELLSAAFEHLWTAGRPYRGTDPALSTPK